VTTQRMTRIQARPSERIPAPAVAGLTRAEERALRRSAPLTPAQFKELRRLAEQGISPLRHI
jgi:predicted nuclease with RNAse H fold